MLASSASSQTSREIQSVQRSSRSGHSAEGGATSPGSHRSTGDLPSAEQVEPKGDDFPKFNDMAGWKVALILLSLGLALFIFALEETIVATSVSTIGAALHVRDSLTWISTSYLLTATVIQPITGRLADAFGTKRLLLLALWIFVAGNIIAGTANNLGHIIAGRLISGIGGAGLLSLVGIIISMLTNERQRSSYMNLINVVFLLSDALGPTLGGLLAQAGQWRWIFLLNAPIGPVITVIILLFLHVPPSSAHIMSISDGMRRMDVLGMTIMVSMLSFVIVCLNIGGQTAPWDSPTVIGMFCAAGACLLIFIVVERYAELPVVPMHLFAEWRWRNVPIMTVNRTLLFFHSFALVFYLPVLLQVTGIEEIVAAALVIPFLSLAGVSSTIASWIVHKYGHVRPFLLVSYVFIPVGMGLLSTLDQHSSLGKVVGLTLIPGFAFGWTTQITMVIPQVGLPPDALATVTALIGACPNLGGVLGVSIIGTIINNRFRHVLLAEQPLLENINLNDAVSAVQHGSLEVRQSVIHAYVAAWKLGCWTLAGVGVFQFLVCLFMKPVEFDQVNSASEGEGEKQRS